MHESQLLHAITSSPTEHEIVRPLPTASMKKKTLASTSLLLLAPSTFGFVPTATVSPPRAAYRAFSQSQPRMVDVERRTGDNVEQIKDTKRDKVMTF